MKQVLRGNVFRRPADVRYRILDDEGVVVRQEAGEVVVLNYLGTRILGLADGVSPVAAWIDVLISEIEIDRPRLEQDVLAFVGELLEQGLLEPVETAADAAPAAAGLRSGAS